MKGQSELFASGRRRLRLGQLWLLFAQVVTITLALLFVAEMFDQRISRQLPSHGGDLSFRHALDRVLPSVVSIATEPNDEVRDFIDGEHVILGSGVIVSEEGHVITNHHVVSELDGISVVTSEGVRFTAELVGSDEGLDIAVLKLDAKEPLPVARFQSKSNPLRVGDLVMSIGSPYGLANTASLGIVSATGRNNLGLSKYEYFIQTDAAINHGSSGGALANSHGELVGISTALFSKQFKGGFAQGIGFAIPAELASAAYDEIVRHGRFRRGWIGIELSNLEGLAAETSLDALVVDRVAADSPAARAGIRDGDLVLEINGRRPSQVSFLEEASGRLLRPGAKLDLTLLREGEEIKLAIDVIER